MKVNSKPRIALWLFMSFFAIVFFYEDTIEQKFNELNKPKTVITVCAPSDMESAFNSALKAAKLNGEYKIEITDNQTANITVIEGGKNEDDNLEIAFSPFVVAIDYKTDVLNQLQKAEIRTKCEFNSEYYQFDLEKILLTINSGNTLWDDIGVKALKGQKMQIFYPAESTVYWYDFYQFMLINFNKGKYPTTSEELQTAELLIKKFLDSDSTIAVENFKELLERCEGIPENAFCIIPEKTLDQSISNNSNCIVLYPNNTSYFHYYIKYDDIGIKLASVFDDKSSDFYNRLGYYCYRNEENFRVTSNLYSTLLYKQDVFNVVKIPTKKETFNSIQTETES